MYVLLILGEVYTNAFYMYRARNMLCGYSCMHMMCALALIDYVMIASYVASYNNAVYNYLQIHNM